MIRYLLMLAVVFATLSATAQNNMEEVLYLKDGTSVRGLIIEFVPGASISIQDAARELHTYAMADVVKIRREPRAKVPAQKKAPFYASLEVGLTDYPTPHYHPIAKNWALFSFDFVAGVKAGKLVATGLGGGLDLSSPRLLYGSVYWDLRVSLTRKKIAPYVDLRAGYIGMLQGGPHDGGAVISPSLGIKIAVHKNICWTAAIGYKGIIMPDASQYYYFSDRAYKTNGHAVTFRTGISF